MAFFGQSEVMFLWDGISRLSKPLDPTYLQTVDWINRLESDISLDTYIQIYKTSKAFDVVDSQIIVSFTYFINNKPCSLIIHISTKFAVMFFAQEPFIKLRAILESDSWKKVFFNNTLAADGHKLFLKHFRINIRTVTAIYAEDHLWSSIFSDPETELYLQERFRYAPIDFDREIVESNVREMNINLTGERFLKLHEKKNLVITVTFVAYLFYQQINPQQANSHLTIL